MLEKAPLLAVSKRIGHSKPSTTTDIYGHVVSQEDKNLANTDNYLSNNSDDEVSKNNNSEPDVLDKIKKLKTLYDLKIISEEEYNERKNVILDKFL